jgi:hypothetical protein
MALGSTQPLMEMSTRKLPRGKMRPAREADYLTAICEPIVYKMWEPQHLTTLWASTACYRDSFTFLLYARNNIGPSTLPCGTPDVTVTSSGNCPPTLTLCVRPNRDSLAHAVILALR